MLLRSINPATEEVIEEFPCHTANQILNIIDQSQKAYHYWRKFHVNERKKFLQCLSDILKKRKNELAKIITKEMGKPIIESLAEIQKCALLCDYYYENIETLLKHELRKGIINHSKEDIISYEPTGTVLAIMPWNFPFWQVFRCAIPTMLSGNCIILKHAPNVSQCAITIETLLKESGLLEDVFRIVLISNEQLNEMIELLISSPQISGVSVTGSVRAGKAVAQLAGKYLKKTIMELGGSDPFIVLEDADIQEAAKIAAQARCQNTGQSCIAAKRFIILDSVYEDFKKYFLEEMKVFSQAIGDPLEENTRIGPIARIDLLHHLIEQVEDAKQKNVHILLGGSKANKEKGYFYNVTILENITKEMRIYKEELFGPVASLYKVKDLEEAIYIANDTPYGLGASLWTKNIERAKQMIPELSFGTVFVNSLVKSDPALPFGGVKESGYGRELSIEGLKEFVNIKTIRIYQ